MLDGSIYEYKETTHRTIKLKPANVNVFNEKSILEANAFAYRMG